MTTALGTKEPDPEGDGQLAVRTRPLPRTLVRSGMEVNEEHTESVQDMIDVADSTLYVDPMSDIPGMDLFTRYVQDGTNAWFKIADNSTEFKFWDQVPDVTGVILAIMPYRLKRQINKYIPGSDNPIMCCSVDMSIGVGIPGGNCTVCPHSRWPTKEEKELYPDKKAPDCPDRVRVFFKESDKVIPSFLDLSGSVNRTVNEYRKQLMQQGAQTFQVITEMSLEATSKNGQDVFLFIGKIQDMVDTTNKDVMNAIEGMQKCIAAVVKQYGTWHLRLMERNAGEGAEQEQGQTQTTADRLTNPQPPAGSMANDGSFPEAPVATQAPLVNPEAPDYIYDTNGVRLRREGTGYVVDPENIPKSNIVEGTAQVQDDPAPEPEPEPAPEPAAVPPKANSRLSQMMKDRAAKTE